MVRFAETVEIVCRSPTSDVIMVINTGKEDWVESDSVCNRTSDYKIWFVNHEYDYRPTSDDTKSTYQLIIKITIFKKHEK